MWGTYNSAGGESTERSFYKNTKPFNMWDNSRG